MRLKLKILLIVLIVLSIIVPLGYAGINVYLKYNPPAGDEYSQGFYDGANGMPSDVKAIRKLHGNKSAYAYSIGRKMGMKNQY